MTNKPQPPSSSCEGEIKEMVKDFTNLIHATSDRLPIYIAYSKGLNYIAKLAREAQRKEMAEKIEKINFNCGGTVGDLMAFREEVLKLTAIT